MISLEIQRRKIVLPAHLQGLITGASERRVLRSELDKRLLPQLAYLESLAMTISEPTLKHMVTKYSEQLVFQPVNEIRHWFTYQSGAYIEPGYPPLYYGRERNKTLSPNKSAVAAVGEAIAGFLAQRLYQCRKLARPNHDCPDIVMEASGKTFLVESKATLRTEQTIREKIDGEIPGMARLVISARLLDRRPVMGLLVGTLLCSETDYYVCVTEVSHAV
jgi:hypothetical protein